VLNLPFNTAALAIANTKAMADPAFAAELKKAVSTTASQLNQKCTDLLNAMKQIPPDVAGQKPLKKQISDVRENLFSVREGAEEVAANPDPQVVAAVTASAPDLLTAIDQLTKVLAGTSAAELIPQLQKIAGDIDLLSRQIGGAGNVPTDKYVDAAYKELAPAHRALDVFMHDLNIYAISPVAMFDVARVWPTGEGVRYGVGPGLRLSIINANFTFGYSFDVHRLPGERAGAIYLKLDVTSLF